MHVDVQIVLVRRAGHAEGRIDPQPDWWVVPFICMLPT